MFGQNKGKYSMDKPTPQGNIKFIPNTMVGSNRASQIENAQKFSSEMKAQTIRSLTSNIFKETIAQSAALSNAVFKTAKKSDLEIMAILDGKELEKDEVKKIRLNEQQSTIRYNAACSVDGDTNTQLKKVFSAKLLNTTPTVNSSISTIKLMDIKKNSTLPIASDLLEKAKIVKGTYEDKKKNYGLSTKASHKDILKELKQQTSITEEKNKNLEKSPNKIIDITGTKSDKVVASDFLKKRIEEIKRFSQEKPKVENKTPTQTPAKLSAPVGFDLELYIGNTPTSQKLMDVSSKYTPFSPLNATSASQQKRKLPEKSPCEVEKSPKEDQRHKKLKQLDDLLSIKSSHAKDVNDPEKNPHFKAFLTRLEQEERIDEKLTTMRNREVNVISCSTCSYTAFKQSDFCKLKRHDIVRHLVLQRFFKCKKCNKRVHTLNKVCPVSSCIQCGSDKFEPCTFKEDTSGILRTQRSETSIDIESEILLSKGS